MSPNQIAILFSLEEGDQMDASPHFLAGKFTILSCQPSTVPIPPRPYLATEVGTGKLWWMYVVEYALSFP